MLEDEISEIKSQLYKMETKQEKGSEKVPSQTSIYQYVPFQEIYESMKLANDLIWQF